MNVESRLGCLNPNSKCSNPNPYWSRLGCLKSKTSQLSIFGFCLTSNGEIGVQRRITDQRRVTDRTELVQTMDRPREVEGFTVTDAGQGSIGCTSHRDVPVINFSRE